MSIDDYSIGLGAYLAMEEAIRASSQDGLIYEDSYVIVTREQGEVVMTGKPIRSPFIYTKASQ
jgi:hypothetical protein